MFEPSSKLNSILECEAFEDFVKIWMCKNCLVGGFLMRIFKWREDFHPSFESPICPVWVHLPGLPLYLYHEDTLMSIANAIGRPLALDLDNVNRSKLGCASFCVELDISIEVIDKIWITFDKAGPSFGAKGFWQKVIFDPLPPFCNRCTHLGHPIDRCLRLDNMVHNAVRGNKVEGEKLSRGESDTMGLQGLQGKGLQFQQNLCVKDYEQNAGQEDQSQDKTDEERSGRYRIETSATQTEGGPGHVVPLFRQVKGSAADGSTQSRKHQVLSTGHHDAAAGNETGLVLNDGITSDLRLSAGAVYSMGYVADAGVEHEVETGTETATEAEIKTAGAVNQTTLNTETTEIEEETILELQKVTADSGVKEEDQTFAGHEGSDTGMEGQKQATQLHSSESYMGQIAPSTEANQITELITTRNSFTSLNEEVSIEELALEEGEIVVSVEEEQEMSAKEGSMESVDVRAASDSSLLDLVRADGKMQEKQPHVLVLCKADQQKDKCVQTGRVEDEPTVQVLQVITVHKDPSPEQSTADKYKHSATVPAAVQMCAADGFTLRTNNSQQEQVWRAADGLRGGQVMDTNNAMEQLKERMHRLRADSFLAAPSLAASTWVPPNMSKHLAKELKKIRKQNRINQNWQDIEDVSDAESEEGELDEKVGSQMLNGGTFLSDEMGDIPRPFKIKSAPNSPKGRNSSYDSSTYLLSRGFI